MSTPLREAMQRDMELRGLSKSTKDAYITRVRRFAEHYGKSPELLGTEEIKDYLHYLITKENRKGSYITAVYCALKFLYETTLERNWDSTKIPRLKSEKKLPVVLSPSEVQDIFNAVVNLKHKAVLMTIYAAGLRISEAANLKLTDIDSKNMQIFISSGKGKKDRYCLLSRKNLEILREYFEKHKPVKWLFPSRATGMPLSSRTIQRVFEKACDKAGIKKRATVHTLRHSFATHLLEAGVNLVQIKELLGHSSINTTMVYLHLQRKDLLDIKSPLDMFEGDK